MAAANFLETAKMDNDMDNTGAKVAAGEVLAVPPKCAVRDSVMEGDL